MQSHRIALHWRTLSDVLETAVTSTVALHATQSPKERSNNYCVSKHLTTLHLSLPHQRNQICLHTNDVSCAPPCTCLVLAQAPSAQQQHAACSSISPCIKLKLPSQARIRHTQRAQLIVACLAAETSMDNTNTQICPSVASATTQNSPHSPSACAACGAAALLRSLLHCDAAAALPALQLHCCAAALPAALLRHDNRTCCFLASPSLTSCNKVWPWPT